jgi:hypothetical protein
MQILLNLVRSRLKMARSEPSYSADGFSAPSDGGGVALIGGAPRHPAISAEQQDPE